LTYPSKTHTDTGILTLIICSDVPGLQVWDTKNDEWLEVEKIVNPMEDMFVVLGRKMQLFAQDQPSVLMPCTHRVALPLNTERSSLLYFLDVPQ
jgi:isopenicillin N synthase-like dioxygenase